MTWLHNAEVPRGNPDEMTSKGRTMRDYFAMLAVAIARFVRGPWWLILLAAMALTAFGIGADRSLAGAFRALSTRRVFAAAFATSVVSNVLFAALCFGLGRGAALAIGA